MDDKRKELLDSILAKAKKMVIDETWPATEDELVEHSAIRGSFDFGFLCGYIHRNEEMMKEAVEGIVEEPNPLQWQIISEDLEGAFVVKHHLTDGDTVKLIIVKED